MSVSEVQVVRAASFTVRTSPTFLSLVSGVVQTSYQRSHMSGLHGQGQGQLANQARTRVPNATGTMRFPRWNRLVFVCFYLVFGGTQNDSFNISCCMCDVSHRPHPLGSLCRRTDTDDSPTNVCPYWTGRCYIGRNGNIRGKTKRREEKSVDKLPEDRSNANVALP